MKETIILILQLIAPLATYFIGWVVGRKKNLAEFEGIQLANFDKAIKIYRGIADDLEKEMMSMKKEMIELTHKLEQANKENAELKEKIHELEQKISSLNNNIK
jgi:peptidoglycan hydrolase CwlO-like protein